MGRADGLYYRLSAYSLTNSLNGAVIEKGDRVGGILASLVDQLSQRGALIRTGFSLCIFFTLP